MSGPSPLPWFSFFHSPCIHLIDFKCIDLITQVPWEGALYLYIRQSAQSSNLGPSMSCTIKKKKKKQNLDVGMGIIPMSSTEARKQGNFDSSMKQREVCYRYNDKKLGSNQQSPVLSQLLSLTSYDELRRIS